MSDDRIKDFAKIVRTSDGRQALYYLEDNAEEDCTYLHQIIALDGCTVDTKLTINAQKTAHQMMAAMTEANADALLRIMQLMGMSADHSEQGGQP